MELRSQIYIYSNRSTPKISEAMAKNTKGDPHTIQLAMKKLKSSIKLFSKIYSVLLL